MTTKDKVKKLLVELAKEKYDGVMNPREAVMIIDSYVERIMKVLAESETWICPKCGCVNHKSAKSCQARCHQTMSYGEGSTLDLRKIVTQSS